MKQLFSIVSISIAVLFIAVLFIVPHHHHKELVCFVMETNEEDNTYNDHSTHERSKQGTGCVNATCSVSIDVSRDNSTLEKEDNQYLLNTLILFCLQYISEPSLTQETLFAQTVASYESAQFGLCCGLRAPPYCLS